ncbi:AMP-binding domain protein [Marssonina coronariae]|uniref:AMP-binding domain protein n=1 Tax=Diplocarpon coronariae TaxID=2795749 RepID=A0A218ZB79_9HELO|nr:AMP-binding domain protein [Marssonina coronariae]
MEKLVNNMDSLSLCQVDEAHAADTARDLSCPSAHKVSIEPRDESFSGWESHLATRVTDPLRGWFPPPGGRGSVALPAGRQVQGRGAWLSSRLSRRFYEDLSSPGPSVAPDGLPPPRVLGNQHIRHPLRRFLR